MHRNLVLFISLIIFGCQQNKEKRPDVSHIAVEVSVKRLEHDLFSATSKEEVHDFLNANKILKQQFFYADQYPHDSILVNTLFDLINDPHIDTLYRETQAAFGDLSHLQAQFADAFRYIKYYYPDFQAPEIQTIVTGFGRDMYISDSVIIVGLDYYIGKGATYRPIDLPQYILRRYEKEYIVPSYVLLLSSKYNKINVEDHTMLADMIFYGKAYYFASKVLPDVPDSILIGYESASLKDVHENQQIVWAHFVENELLYETSHFVKKKYMDERPKTLEIGNKAPGRIGVWLGWEIVKQYMRAHSEVNLQELMETEDAQQIFMKSRYKPAP